jgi:hypothetical protein
MTLREFLTQNLNLQPEQVENTYIVFNKQINDQIITLQIGKYILMPNQIDDNTFYLAADCLLEINGIYKNTIANLPQDQMEMVDADEWLYYQSIIDSQQTEEDI